MCGGLSDVAKQGRYHHQFFHLLMYDFTEVTFSVFNTKISYMHTESEFDLFSNVIPLS